MTEKRSAFVPNELNPFIVYETIPSDKEDDIERLKGFIARAQSEVWELEQQILALPPNDPQIRYIKQQIRRAERPIQINSQHIMIKVHEREKHKEKGIPFDNTTVVIPLLYKSGIQYKMMKNYEKDAKLRHVDNTKAKDWEKKIHKYLVKA